MKLTDDQKAKILQISREAQHFLNSELGKAFDSWVDQEKKLAIDTLVTNMRDPNEQNMTRAEFVERRSAYYQALETVRSVFKQFASREADLKQIEEHEQSKSQ